MVSIVPADKMTRDMLLQGAPFFAEKPDCLMAMNRNEQLGYIFYQYDKEAVALLDLKADDQLLIDGLLRAALNKAYESGITIAKCGNTMLFPYMIQLGFHEVIAQGKTEYQTDIRSILFGRCLHENL